MTIEQANAIIAERPHLHVARDGSTKGGGLNRPIGERFIQELSVLDRPRIAETGTGLSTLLFLSLDPGAVISRRSSSTPVSSTATTAGRPCSSTSAT